MLDSIGSFFKHRTMPSLPTALVTNDDGIDSPFLHKLIEGLIPYFQIKIAAPMREQSWIGRAMTRHRPLDWREKNIHNCQSWAIDGTPSDCINIALAHFLKSKPDVVISGINIGFNASIPLIYSSGTIAGALEGANWGIPAVAASQSLAHDLFASISRTRELPESIDNTLAASAQHTAQFAQTLTGQDNPNLIVHNLNFPQETTVDTPWETTIPARFEWGSLFTQNANGQFQFQYKTKSPFTQLQLSDHKALENGSISHSSLNFSNLR